MRLLKLSANNPHFRTVAFNRTGITFVVAEQRAPKANRTKTYNGVGKSLMLAIVDYCLGSNTKPAFKSHLKDWTFYLEVEVEEKSHTIARSADDPSLIHVDKKKTSLADLKRFLEASCFDIPENIPSLTFRSLVGHLVRFGKGAYSDYKTANIDEGKNEYGVMLRNAFLLGLDVELAQKKQEIRKQQSKLQDTLRQLDSDPLFSDLLVDDTVDMELTALREQADRLARDLKNFKVAENYHEIQKEADQVSRTLDKLRREAVKIEQAVAQVESSLKTRGDIAAEKVYRLYEEAGKAFPKSVVKKIDEVLAFQESLKAKRIYRLTLDRQHLLAELRRIKTSISDESASLDGKLRYLGEHRALDEYLAVSKELGEFRARIAKLEESKSIRQRALVRQQELKRDMAEQNIETAQYLESAKDLITEAAMLFRSFAKRMYGTRKSGLVVTSDDGENQQRYRIEAHIEMDAAEGIGETRLFCYDLMMLSLGRGHRMKFLVHDSTLFGPVDPRQRFTMLQVAHEVAEKQGLQYVATLNEHDVSSIQSQVELKEGEFEKVFAKRNVVLRLSDEKPEKKLLGMNIDMNYLEE